MELDAKIIAKKVSNFLNQVGLPHGEFSSFLRGLQKCGPTAIVGGAVRDWALGLSPRDLDFTVDCSASTLQDFIHRTLTEQSYDENQFGGFKVYVAGILLDIWPLSQTWAFLNDPSIPVSFQGWLKTPFFNIDSIVYSLDDQEIIEGGFFNAITQKNLDIINPKNPFSALCYVKTILHLKKYKMTLSPALDSYLAGLLNREKPLTETSIQKTYRQIFKQNIPEDFLQVLPEHLRVPKKEITMERIYLVTVKREAREIAPLDWKDRVAAVAGVKILNSERTISLTVADDATLQALRDLVGTFCHIEPKVDRQVS